MAEDIDKEVLANAQAQILAALYSDFQKTAFKPITLTQMKGDPKMVEGNNQFKREIAEGTRNQAVNLFLMQYKSYGGQKQIDGIEYEGRFYGRGVKEAMKAIREPAIVSWKDLPEALGFEKFLPKKS